VTTISATFAAGQGIARRDRLDREAVEDLAGLGRVVDRQDELACDPPSRAARPTNSARVKTPAP